MDTYIYNKTYAQAMICGLDIVLHQCNQADGQDHVCITLSRHSTGDVIATYDGISCDAIAYLIDAVIARYAQREGLLDQ